MRHLVSTPFQLLRTPLSRSDRSELMDAPIEDQAELLENFRDIERVNSLLGGTAVVVRHLPGLLAGATSRPVTVLDLATGSADIPVAIVRWARRQNLAVTVTASDYSPEILHLAGRQCADYPEISLATLDARNVDLPDNHVDIVLCSLALHHFTPDDAVRVLREMHRVGRQGFILNDLRRSRTGFAAAWFAAMFTTRNRLTRHDAPLSVRRAYTPSELADLLQRAGIEGASITTHPWFRMAAVVNAQGAAS